VKSSFLPIIRHSGFVFLNITEEHAVRAARLPMHHKDPFDRMLCAQAASEELTIVTRDTKIAAYGVAVMMS
jgi:PIN domain nuclease of toxin-antitoxin system